MAQNTAKSDTCQFDLVLILILILLGSPYMIVRSFLGLPAIATWFVLGVHLSGSRTDLASSERPSWSFKLSYISSFSPAGCLLIVLFFQFIKIKDLKSQRTILRGIFVGWSSLFIILIIVNPSLIYFIVLSGIAGIVNLIALFSLVDLIKEERNTLTDKEIYLLQQLANKK